MSGFIELCKSIGSSTEELEKADKLGMDTSLRVAHPYTKKEIPVYIANFILMGYGTGAVFGCPAHDQRDFEFAKKYKLEIVQVVSKTKSGHKLNEAYTEDGLMINSEFLDGLSTQEAQIKIISDLKNKGAGREAIKYKLRDWGISRQRYWGCPIPIMYLDDGTIVTLSLIHL